MPSNSKSSPTNQDGNVILAKAVLESNTYKDYSGEVDMVGRGSDQSRFMKGRDHHFPVKLHFMLEEIEKDDRESSIVSWQPHGRCFVVHKRKEFVEKVLPFWFVQSKYTSFQRQLNLYGFRRITTGRDKGGYYHELFLRGKMFLSKRIQRTVLKGRGSRKPASPETEPNFYYMSTCLPSTGNQPSPTKPFPPRCPRSRPYIPVTTYPLLNDYIDTQAISFPIKRLLPSILNSSAPQVQPSRFSRNHAGAVNGGVTWVQNSSSAALTIAKEVENSS